MNLLIVDDEPLIHVSIEFSLKQINGSQFRIEHAYNGSDMLNKMEICEPDIALVDIRMPGMDGLTAISNARKRWPNTHYYIMSGFSEFEYAREAIKLNVVDYLLKPLDTEQLSDIIARVKEEKNREGDRIRESFHAWLVGTLHRHDVTLLYQPLYYSVIILFTYDSPDKEYLNRLPKAIEDRQDRIVIPCWEGQLVLCFSQEENALRELLNEFPQKDYPKGMTCFITQIRRDPSVLAESMHHILDLSPMRIFYGIGLRYKTNRMTASGEELRMAKDWIELRDHYREKRYADYITKSTALIPMLQTLSPAQCRHLTIFLSAIFDQNLSGPGTAEYIGRILTEIGESMVQYEAGGDRIDGVIEYVQENFCEDISISKLAMQFDLSPNYLSTLFKKKLGINFVDYLTALRIAKAKELLTTGRLSIKEVGESVGYYSQSYFTKIFIKKEGVTPGEYRKHAEGTQETG